MKRKFLAGLLVSSMVAASAFTGCTNNGGTQPDTGDTKPATEDTTKENENKGSDDTQTAAAGDVLFWTFSDEIKQMVDIYQQDNPDLGYKVNVVITPNEQYQSKLDPALQAGKSAPDIFALDAGYSKKYMNSDYTVALADVGITDEDVAPIMDYVKAMATDDNGRLKGLSWQATPGAFFYRRSIAQKYLGVSEPEDVQPLVKDYDTFIETAKKIRDGSNGEVKALSGIQEFTNPFYASRTSKWVEDNKLVIDPAMDKFLEIAKTLEEENLTAQADQWSEAWYAGMNGDNVFGYCLPTWGLHYNLKTNCENADAGTTTSGDWGMVQGPTPYFWGGTYLTIRSGSEASDQAATLLRYLTLDQDFLKKWAEQTGDVVSNTEVVEQIKDSYTEPFLGGQNHYAAFAEMAKGIDASIITGSDSDIQTLFYDELKLYARGEKDKDTAIADFKAAVKNLFPDYTVE